MLLKHLKEKQTIKEFGEMKDEANNIRFRVLANAFAF